MAKILLAEDDLFLRDIYKDTLKGEGFEVTIATDGNEALQKFKEGSWDLVLLDVLMPQMSGIDVLKHVKDLNPRTLAKHIVFMTNSDEKKELKDVIDMTDGVILKTSYTPDQFVEEIKAYLNN